jgi:hypothetical protein
MDSILNRIRKCHWLELALCFLYLSGVAQGAELDARMADQSVGLFVGIGKFEFRAGLEDLDYAPDDAVGLAHRMVVELKMIPAGKAQLVLVGEPKSARRRKQLSELQALRVEVVKGTKNGLLKALEKFAGQATAGGLAVMSFSGHGYETQNDVYLMPSNGNWQTVRTTGVSFESVLEAFQASKATSKVLLFDACRQVPDMAKLDRDLAEKMFRERVKSVPGLTVLASCSAGEKSWQAKTLEQGVFTNLVLERLKKPDVSWSELGEDVVQANEAWFGKFEVKGPRAWRDGGNIERPTSNAEHRKKEDDATGRVGGKR